MRKLIAALAFAGLVACGGSANNSTQAVQENGDCPQNSSILNGTKGGGEACSKATDCKPVTCECTNSVQKAWCGVQCQDGKCASDPCPATKDDSRYCSQ
jgi:hypothetical protein